VYPVHNKAFDAWIKLDFDQDGKPDYTSPYQLRKALAQTPLDFGTAENRFKLGRALYHIAQRRGFKSSRKVAEDTTSDTAKAEVADLQLSEKKKNKNITELFEKYPEAKTIGWLFALLENDNIRVRENVAQHAIRENYKDEIKYIFQTQNLGTAHSLYIKLVEKGNNKNDGSIFYKRPLRSQKGLIGKCTLEPSKYRAPVSHPQFEIFRAWALLNNIKYTTDTQSKRSAFEPLPLALKQEIYAKLFFRKSKAYFLFSEIIHLVQAKFPNAKLNYPPKTTVMACPVSARLHDIFGDDYLNVKIAKEKAPKSDKNYYDIEDIWHVLFSYEDQEFVVEFAENKLKLSPDNIKNFVTAWNAVPVGYGMLSINAMSKINRFLLKGLIYTEAVLLANLPAVIGQETFAKHEHLLLESIANLIEENRQQKTILSLVNQVISQHKNLSAHEKFAHKNNNYQLAESDLKDIQAAIHEHFGANKWQEFSEKEQKTIFGTIKDCYQAYFATQGIVRDSGREERIVTVSSHGKKYEKTESGYYRLPKLKDTLAEFLQLHFNVEDKQLAKIYHPSEINIYPPAKPDKDGVLKLGSPKTGSFKNPMAMRTLHELRKLMNYLIETGQIDSDTRVVVEVARELNDANKRWAIEAWQKQREAENKEFAQAIDELLQEDKSAKANPRNNDDIDKLRLFYEQNTEQTLPEAAHENDTEKGKKKKSTEKEEAVRWTGLGKKLIEKYRLWQEQGYRCIYTGKIIKLSDLFSDNIIDFEHTIPRSISFDNSMANLTVCYADYNRNVKKKQLPTQLSNYNEDFGGYTAIVPRLEAWKDKVERIKQQIEFWKAKAKKGSKSVMIAKGSDVSSKDDAIRQRHLWQMELDYWKNKLDRFTMTEVTSGFKNSQKIDTQLISKYALHYLKTYFEKVEVQKGSITAEFRKIYGLQSADEKKDRSKHAHHAKDAAVLTLIPVAAKRDEILKTYYEHPEAQKSYNLTPYEGFKREFVFGIEDNVLINNLTNNQALTPAKRKVRKRGKEVIIDGQNRWATGDSIRGQLHQETFYGAVKLAKKDENGTLLKDENGKFVQKEIQYVKRVPFLYKKDANSQGFKDLEEIEKQIVDEGLKVQIKQQVQAAGSLQAAFEKGIYLLDKKGNPHGNKIRHIRVWASVAEPLRIKKQTYLSEKEYKQFYLASNGENFAYGLYENIQKQRGFKLINLFNLSEFKKTSDVLSEMFEQQIEIQRPKAKVQLKYVLTSGLKVIFYKDSLLEIQDLATDVTQISKRLYVIDGFEKDGRIRFKHHIDSRSADDLKALEATFGKAIWQGFSQVNFEISNPKLKLSKDNLNFLVEGYDFEIKMDGTIQWLKH
jgi:CRISPR-associated endonuclease Csn1